MGEKREKNKDNGYCSIDELEEGNLGEAMFFGLIEGLEVRKKKGCWWWGGRGGIITKEGIFHEKGGSPLYVFS